MPDKYTNRAMLQVTESAANTLTFSQLTTGISTFSKQAFVIHRINWYLSRRDLLLDYADYSQVALTSSNKMTGLGLDDPSVIFMREYHAVANGTPATMNRFSTPDVDDFSSLPGGGLIVPANPIFMAIESVSIASAMTASCRIDFTVVDLKADEYIELVEALRMIE